MSRKEIVAGVLVMVMFAGALQAQQDSLDPFGLFKPTQEDLHGAVGMTYQSKYIWRGFDVYKDMTAIEPFVNLDLYGTGFGFMAMAHRANAEGFEDGERWDYMPYYNTRFFDGEPWATNVRFSYVYYNFPDSSSHTDSSTDLQEAHAFFSWPEIMPMGIVPRYVLVKLWPSNSGTVVGTRNMGGGTASGWAHIFMLDFPINLQDISPEMPAQVLNVHTEYVYNDGVDPRGAFDVDHDWSNAVFGITTDFEIADNLIFTPGVHYQSSWEDSVNTEDEAWATLKLTYKF